MKGVYNKEAIGCIVDPLKAISSIFNNNSVHVVYETNDDGISIGITNIKKSIKAVYNFPTKNVVANYEPVGEIGIWDVKPFIDIVGKYQNNIYVDDVELDVVDNKLHITCGKENTVLYLGQLDLFKDFRKKPRKLKEGVLDEVCRFTLDGNNLKKILTNISVFAEQDEIVLSGKEGDDGVNIRLQSAGPLTTRNDSVISDIAVSGDFSMKFPKEDIKGLLGCNDSFEVIAYTGKMDLVVVEYSPASYNMAIYLTPIADID